MLSCRVPCERDGHNLETAGILPKDTAERKALSVVCGSWPLGGEVSDKSRENLLIGGFLLYVMQGARRAIDDIFQFGPGVADPLLQIGAPTTESEAGETRERYERLVHSAWRALTGTDLPPVEQGMPLARLEQVLGPWLQADAVLPPAGERRFRLVPESVAGVVSVQQTGRLAPGKLVIVDVGAGSSDLSVNDVGVPELNGRIHCFQCASPPAGVSRMKNGGARVVLDEIEFALRTLWQAAYKQVRGRPRVAERWSHLNVLLLGGGARRPDVRPEARQ